MNIYVRFFDFDTLVSDEDGVIQFLQAIPDVELTDEIVDEIKTTLIVKRHILSV